VASCVSNETCVCPTRREIPRSRLRGSVTNPLPPHVTSLILPFHLTIYRFVPNPLATDPPQNAQNPFARLLNCATLESKGVSSFERKNQRQGIPSLWNVPSFLTLFRSFKLMEIVLSWSVRLPPPYPPSRKVVTFTVLVHILPQTARVTAPRPAHHRNPGPRLRRPPAPLPPSTLAHPRRSPCPAMRVAILLLLSALTNPCLLN
jgi:hypothetical protein